MTMEGPRPGIAARPSLLAISKNKASSSALSITAGTTSHALENNNVEYIDDDDEPAEPGAGPPLRDDGPGSPTSLDHASSSIYGQRDSQSIVSSEEYAHVEASSGTADPRAMLRQQLQRNATSSSVHNPLPSRSRKNSYKGSISSVLSTPRSGKGLKDADTIPQDDFSTAKLQREVAPSRGRPNKRRYFVLTSAGKPVFASNSRWPDEVVVDSDADRQSFIDKDDEEFTSLVGVIQAIISLYAVENDRIRYIDAGRLKIAFFLRNPIYLVAVSDWGEPESVLRTHLEYLYLQILSTTTASQLQNIFSRRSNFDLRRMLQGTEGMMNSLLDNFLPFDFQALLGSLSVFPVSSALRGECSDVLKKPSSSSSSSKKAASTTSDNDILYAILVHQTTIITLLRHKTHSIHPSDLHILLNTIESTKDLQVPGSENWLPICLPKFNSKGFVYAFISYFGREQEERGEDNERKEEGGKAELNLGVILITSNKEGFFDMQAWKETIASRLFSSPPSSSGSQTSLYDRLLHDHTSHKSLSASLHDFAPRITSIIRHWIYKSKIHVQVLQAPFYSSSSSAEESLYDDLNDRKRLITLYQEARDALHPSSLSYTISGGRKAPAGAKLIYAVGEHEAVLAITNATHEIYLALPPQVPKKMATDAAHALVRWVQKNESRLALIGGPHF